MSAASETTTTAPDEAVLDHPVFAALTGHQAHLAIRSGSAVAFDREISPFVGSALPGADAYADLATLLGPAGTGAVAGTPLPMPSDWTETFRIEGFQMIGRELAERLRAASVTVDPEIVTLTPADSAAMLDLATRTRPGPFGPRTGELGRYLGIRDGDALVAMAGERMHPPGFTEISAVCTDDAYRGRGYAGRLVEAVAAGIVARGEVPILHVAGDNLGAVRLYEKLGFSIRRTITFVGVQAPL
ncbi:GNAT family N-acetyltransferase [Leifsonia sp. YIM 134122]|uniref:GNAT family N-acetyltransferase n=1 Tax=Leifsonia stereocauli TaxID=3134136 RepID=A0ABU9W7B5_9MICO